MSHFPSSKSLKIGLGIRGIIGALVLGPLFLFQPIFENSLSQIWATSLLLLAAFVYVIFSMIWDTKYLLLTTIQLIVSLFILGLTYITGNLLFVAFGLFAHALWDLWHLTFAKKYIPWWYAGACIYIDVIASLLIVFKSN
jgi:hypothetical protein